MAKVKKNKTLKELSIKKSALSKYVHSTTTY